MNASDRLTLILSLLQDVSGIVDGYKELSADEWLSLTNLSNKIDELEPGKFNLWLQQLALESSDKAAINAIHSQFHTVCSSLADVYCHNQGQWYNQSLVYVQVLMKKAAHEFAVETEKADAVFKHMSEVEDAFHKGARYVNSRERMEDVDKSVYAVYASEIKKLTGRDIPAEDINAGFLLAKEEKAAADEAREVVKRKVQEHFSQLRNKTNEYVLDDIYGSVYTILVALNDTGYPEPTSRRPGRPPLDERLEAAGIEDFESCFINPIYYKQVANAIEQSEPKSINTSVLNFIAGYLINHKWVKEDAATNLAKLCDFFINAFPDKFSFKNGRSAYNASKKNSELDKSVADEWERKLMIKR